MILAIPLDKQVKAVSLLTNMVNRKKATIKQLQVLMGYLNFLTKVIVLGRMFMRRMYAKCGQTSKNGRLLNHHHHMSLDSEFKFDCNLWLTFLTKYQDDAVCCPMMDVDMPCITAKQLRFYSDASASEILGFGAVYETNWLFSKWETNYIQQHKPSIKYLELYALVAPVLTWEKRIQNICMVLYCDNQSVVDMVNSQVSKCKNCIFLLRLLMLNNLVHNRRIFA